MTAPTAEPATRPTLSIGVPTLGRPEQLTRCLARLAEEAAPLRAQWSVELLVADGNAPESEGVVDAVRDRFDVVRYLVGPLGVSPARNILARNAHGDFLIYVDDDVTVGRRSLELLVAAADPRSVLAARVANLGHFGDESDLGAIGRDGYGHPVPPGTEPDYVISAYMLVPREIYESVHWVERFKVAHLDDIMFGIRVRDRGFDLRMCPGARADHGPRKGRPAARLAGHQTYVALERWRRNGVLAAGWSALLCTMKTVWSYRPSPWHMGVAVLSSARGIAWFVADRSRAAASR